jgi:hypothetical protein
MGIVFGLFLLAVLIAGLLHRRHENIKWQREERHEESGAWVDKRSGERGTYGSLDAEREAERHALSRQGRINDLALDIRNYAFEHIPDFHSRSDADIRNFTALARSEAVRLFSAAEALLNSQMPDAQDAAGNDPHAKALKKMLLDFSYEQFPQLLDLELDAIRLFDRFAAGIADGLLEKMKTQ